MLRGRLFSLFRLSPLLNAGAISASLRSSGKTLFLRQLLIRIVSSDKWALMLFFNILTGISPFSVPFLEDRFKISYFTPSSLTLLNFKLDLEWNDPSSYHRKLTCLKVLPCYLKLTCPVPASFPCGKFDLRLLKLVLLFANSVILLAYYMLL